MGLEGALAQPLHYPSAQVPAHLGGSAGELRQALDHIANRVDVVHTGPLDLFLSCLYLLALCGLHSDLLEVQRVGGRRPANCEQNRIEFFRWPNFFALLVFDDDAEFPVFLFFDSIREGGLNDVDVPLLQIFENECDHVSVEGAKVISSRHQAHVVSHSVQEPCDFHCHVAPSDDERLSGRCFLHEDVVAGDGVVRSVQRQVGRPCSGGNQEVAGLDFVVKRVLVVVFREVAGPDVLVDDLGVLGADEGVLVLEGGQAVQVVEALFPVDVGNIPEINRFYVALHPVLQLRPVEPLRQLLVPAALVDLLRQVPPVLARVGDFLARLGSLVHQLLGDAAHVHAGAPESPLRLVGRLIHKVDDDHVEAVLVGLEGSRQSP